MDPARERSNPMKLLLVKTLVLLLAAAASAAAAEEAKLVRSDTADTVLQPGDILFNYSRGEKESWYAKIIAGTQRAIQKTAGRFRASLRRGDASFVHVALYLGKGQVAEAHGTNPDDAAVKIDNLDTHPGERNLEIGRAHV